jgi:hypothetical protein
MDTRNFHRITLATALVAALGAATSLALAPARPADYTIARPAAACPLIALPATVFQSQPKS